MAKTSRTAPTISPSGTPVLAAELLQFHVMNDGWFIVKVIVAVVPDLGTLPVPVQPVQKY